MQATAERTSAVRSRSRRLLPPCALEPSLDPAVFGALASALNPVVLAQIYREFLAQTRSRIEEPSIQNDDQARASLAHTIKGTAGMLGAEAIARCAAYLETPEAEVKGTLTAMSTACAALETALRERQITL